MLAFISFLVSFVPTARRRAANRKLKQMKQSSKDTDEMDNEDNEDLFAELGGITLSKYMLGSKCTK